MAEEYAGDISSRDAWEILTDDPRAVLVDVRTDAEWRYVGLPDLTPVDKQTVCVCWQTYPNLQINPRFVEEVEGQGVSPDATVLLLCRSGQRSRYAAIALTAQGYGRCYNVADGFEGPHDAERHRGTRVGWKAAGLPWRQE